MVIDRIEKKDNSNVIIYLDNGELIYLAYEVMLKNGLRKGVEVSESHFDFLIRENQKFFIKRKAYDYLGKRIHSAYELRIKLLRKKYESDLINDTIDDLRNGGYLDDPNFAEIFIEEKIRLKSWGRSKLKSELIKRGIAQEIIETVFLEKLPGETDEIDMAFQLAQKKYASISNRNLEKQKTVQKLYSFLMAKGYSFDICRKVVEKVVNFSIEEGLK